MFWDQFNHESEFVVREKTALAAIPCLVMRPQGNDTQLPTIINYHGWHSNKYFHSFRATVLACYGFQVIVPDALYHGDRGTIDYDKPGALKRYFWEIVINTVEESGALIKSVTEMGVSRIGVMGTSMGGFSAAGVFMRNHSLSSMVNINGSCAWIKTEELLRLRDGLPPLQLEHVHRLLSYDPLHNKQKLKGRPVLMLHGDRDSTIPIEGQRHFYSKVAPLYADRAQNLRLIEVPGLDHHTSVRMLQKAMEWFKQHI